jgi:hypothetical protein
LTGLCLQHEREPGHLAKPRQRLNGIAIASGRVRVAIASLSSIERTLRSRPGRSSHGFNRTMMNAAFEAEVPEIRSNPTTVTTVSTPGTWRAISCTLRATAIVRTCAAASGRINCMNTAPLSSSGTNPVGVIFCITPIDRTTAPRMPSTSSTRRAPCPAVRP